MEELMTHVIDDQNDIRWGDILEMIMQEAIAVSVLGGRGGRG